MQKDVHVETGPRRVTLDAKDISWAAGRRMIIDGIEVHALPGEILGILGPNGSGKSTLMRILARMNRPAQGHIALDNRPYDEWSRREFAQMMSVVEQQVATEQDMLVQDVIDLGRIPHRGRWSGVSSEDRAVVDAAAQRMGVQHLLERRWHTLSGGEQQRVHVARAFAQQGQIMLLDEPTNHLDIAYQLEVLETVRQSRVTAIIALHDLNLAMSYCDRVLVLQDGRAVAYGRPEEIVTVDLIREVYRVEVQVLYPAPGGRPVFHYLRSIRSE